MPLFCLSLRKAIIYYSLICFKKKSLRLFIEVQFDYAYYSIRFFYRIHYIKLEQIGFISLFVLLPNKFVKIKCLLR